MFGTLNDLHTLPLQVKLSCRVFKNKKAWVEGTKNSYYDNFFCFRSVVCLW